MTHHLHKPRDPVDAIGDSAMDDSAAVESAPDASRMDLAGDFKLDEEAGPLPTAEPSPELLAALAVARSPGEKPWTDPFAAGGSWFQLAEGPPTQYSLRDLLVLTLAGAIGLASGRVFGGELFSFVTGVVAALLFAVTLVQPPQTKWGRLLMRSMLTMYALSALALIMQAGK